MSLTKPCYHSIFASIMSVIFLLIIVSISVASVFLLGFIWAVKNGQYEDDYSPSVRMLFDDEHLSTDKPKEEENQNEENNSK